MRKTLVSLVLAIPLALTGHSKATPYFTPNGYFDSSEIIESQQLSDLKQKIENGEISSWQDVAEPTPKSAIFYIGQGPSTKSSLTIDSQPPQYPTTTLALNSDFICCGGWDSAYSQGHPDEASGLLYGTQNAQIRITEGDSYDYLLTLADTNYDGKMDSTLDTADFFREVYNTGTTIHGFSRNHTNIEIVPEPTTLIGLSLGAGIGILRRKRPRRESNSRAPKGPD